MPGEHDKRSRNQSLIRNGISELTKVGDEVILAGQVAVHPVGGAEKEQGGNGEQVVLAGEQQPQEQGHGHPPSSGSLEEEERELELLLEEELELEELDELDEDQEELLDEEELELLKELEDEELELLEDDELEEEGGALLEESGGSGAEELCQELEDELLEEEELELLLDLGSNSNESPPPAELLDESPSSTSWYRLTRVRTVSPSLPAGVFSASR